MSGPRATSDESGEAIATQATFNGAGAIHDGFLEEIVELTTIIRDAIDEKYEAMEITDAALEKEWTAYDMLEVMLDSGDFGDLKKRDIIKAKRKVDSAIRLENLSKKVLRISVKELEHALRALGIEPDGN